MKRIIATIIFLHSLTFSFGQKSDIKAMVDSLQFLKSDTLDCSAGLYWRIIAKGDKAIPFLIDKLADTTATRVNYHCKRTTLNVGEVAQFALTQIAEFPAFLITKMQFDVITIDTHGECWSFYDFLFINSNKPRYQQNVRDWYNRERSKYRVRKIPDEKQSVCQNLYGIDKYYSWTK